MRSPEAVLKSLKSHSESPEYQYERLYRNLFNPAFYLLAYQQTYSKPGNMSPGVDGKTFDGMNLARVNKIINSMKDHSYCPKPARRTYIPKKNGKPRPLGIQSSDDKLVQQVMKMILESIYEDTFTDTSHGFRPNRSCHTALSQIKINFTGVRWFVEGDIHSYFDMVDHHVLISILRRRIKDEVFISLIWKFLRAGHLENGQLHRPGRGLHQGSIISPILANIYLNELDCFMATYKTSFDKGKKRQLSKEYISVQNKEQRLRKSISGLTRNSRERIKKLKELKTLRNQRVTMSCSQPMDSSFRRIFYQRYADDFLIGVIGSKQDAITTKQIIQSFLLKELHLELSEEKTLVTHGYEKAQFLGYEITIGRKGVPSRDKLGKLSDRHHGRVRLYLPKQAWLKKLIQSEAIKIEHNADGKEIWKPKARNNLLYLPDHEIFRIYNWEIAGLYQYYRFADNASVLNDYYYIMKYSLAKTLAGKHKSSVHKIMRKYFREGRMQTRYQTHNGFKAVYLYDYGFKKQPIITNHASKKQSKELLTRFSKGCCELCGETKPGTIVHHVRKLSELSGVTDWEQKMLAMNRKTLVVCENCYNKIVSGF